MISKNIFQTFLIASLALLGMQSVKAQDHIKIRGTVIDAQTKEGLAFANVNFVGNESVGTTTDIDGSFMLESKWGTDSLRASYIGYNTQIIKIDLSAKKQDVSFELQSESENLTTVEVVTKRKKYRRKNNPAVELIKNVMAHKNDNRMEGQDFFEYDKYEKTEYALNNFTDLFEKRKSMKKFRFLQEYVDTSDLNGKPFLPFYIREIASKVYYRKNPTSKKEYREGIKMTGIDEWIDDASVSALNDILYQEVNIYDNDVFIFNQSFVSPINDVVGNLFYRYYILDTIEYKGMDVIEMGFMPANKQDLGFKGSLYILNDSSYAIVKADLTFTEQININWVNDIQLLQEFEKQDSFWILTKDQIITDFALSEKSIGIFGKRTVMYKDQKFNIPRDNSIYSGTEKVIEGKDESNRDNSYWLQARQEQLTENEEGIYEMIDTLKTIRPFRNIMNVITLFSSGYYNTENFDIGSIGTFFSFNDVEGFRLRFGGTTTPNLFPKVQIEGYGAYGMKDRAWKYGAAMTYSFNEDFRNNPKHFLRFSYLNETKLVGQEFDFKQDESLLFSFQRGNTSKMLFLKSYELNYFYEFPNDLSFKISGKNQNHRPIGTLEFKFMNPELPDETQILKDLTLTAFQADIRWAPNEKYVQGQNFRHPIFSRNPIFNVFYEKGIKGSLGGQYNYHKLEFDAFKRLYLPPFGYTDVIFEAGKVWGEGIPYYLLLLPKANQTFISKHRHFNMMNYLEFSNDFYLAWNLRHKMKGFLFNKIPLIKKLNLREVISFKGMWGSLSDKNNPDVNPNFIQFLKDENGVAQTTSLQAKPYMEASVGVANIFKVARIDLIKRLTYLDNPGVPQMFGVKGLGLRLVVGFEF